jgi:hypothetical protein
LSRLQIHQLSALTNAGSGRFSGQF